MKSTGPFRSSEAFVAYEAGKHDALLEAAADLDMSAQTIRLHAGELSAQEMRAVKAVLRWKMTEFRRRAKDDIKRL